ncbi:GRP family sugar transporter [Candidatus Saccharibacteria bacterium]|nr:GRP family sugar transporter [Candidatus Saccharibacteria bacterium]
MGIIYLFLSITFESIGKTFDKLNFTKNHISVRQNLLLVFTVMAVSVVAFSLITQQSWGRLPLTAIAVLAGIIALSFAGNILDEHSLKRNDLSLREPLVNFEPILTGLVAYALFPGERKPIYLVIFIAGAVIVWWGVHRRKLKDFQSKGMRYLWIATMLYAAVPILYQIALDYLPPANIALVRVVAILVLLRLFFPPKKNRKLTGKMKRYGMIAGLVYAGGAIVGLYAIKELGLLLTMSFLMLGPALRFLAGKLFLREKVRHGEIISSALLAVAVAAAAIL